MISRTLSALFALLIFIPSLTFAADHKMVIQVNTNDPLVHKMAINNAKNLKTQLGKDAVDVEIVVFGPGVTLLKASSSSADEVKNLMSEHGIKMSVCEGTLKFIAKKNGGQEPKIIEGVTRVPTGAIRILELQEKGYAYMRP
ncbi:MAG: DsrE family protein [Thiotrichaceae bacterium]